MPKRKIITPAPVAPTSNIPAPKRPARALGVPAKPVTATALPATATAPAVAPAPASAPAKPSVPKLARDAAGIIRNATNYERTHDRDLAYLAFIGAVARANNHSATLRQIHEAGETRSDAASDKRFNPLYAGSAKATDIGAINRQIKAGYFTRSADGYTLTSTPLARQSSAYCSGKLS